MSKKNTLIYNSITWIILIGIVLSGFLIPRYENYSSFYISLLTVELILVVYFIKWFTKPEITASRILLGLLFIYSGFVKGVDPLGTEYRIVDYFIAFGTDWAIPFALPLSVLMNAVEFVLGILLLLNIGMQITSWLVMLMMAVFTVVTFNDALYSPVPDCGCFGDALVISNWQTFYKNLIIDALLLIVFFSRNKVGKWFVIKIEWAIVFVAILGFFAFEIYNIRHLPVIDFREWKEGNKMVNDNPMPQKYFLTYKNRKTGEKIEYLSPDYPYNDSIWMAEWEFVSQRIEDPNPKLHDLRIEDVDGIDYTEQIIANPGFQFILVAYDLSNSSIKNWDKLEAIVKQSIATEISFAVITSSLPEEVMQFQKKNLPDAEFYYADDVTMMSMIRSNPGLILLKNGVILDKWHFNDYPSISEIQQEFDIP